MDIGGGVDGEGAGLGADGLRVPGGGVDTGLLVGLLGEGVETAEGSGAKAGGGAHLEQAAAIHGRGQGIAMRHGFSLLCFEQRVRFNCGEATLGI